ncbi:MAG: dienelactone hydrolase family protein [Verrucomicrobiaceae bacterium]|nr:dienelactone hydrolase family protein [Verrucomicrobiaceae bacterium]
MKTAIVTIALMWIATAALHAQTLPGFTFNTADNSFTYDDPDDAGAVVTGYIRKPTTAAATGQAVIICHGKGGSASNFNAVHAANFVQWGYYCIVPQLSHAGAGGGTSSNEGYCPENSRIARACRKILADVPTVNATRTAIFGHSMGAYFIGGFCGEDPTLYPAIRAAVEGAGGSQASGTATSNATPTPGEVVGITAPMLMFHGTQDTSNPLSQNLQTSLNAHAVTNKLFLYQGVPHAIMDAAQKQADIYAITRAWFTSNGVLSYANNTTPTITAPATVTVTAGVASAPIAITLGDAETAAGSLTLQAFSTDTDVAATTTPPVPFYAGRLNNSGLVLGGSGANRTLTITSTAGVTGTVEVALVVTDGSVANGQLAAMKTLQVTIQAASQGSVNFRPEISWIADQRTTPGVAVSNVAFTVSDVETAAASLAVTAASSNTTLLPVANIALGGSGGSRTVTLTPVSGQSGTATVTLTVNDGSKTSATAFTLTVANAVGGNTAPTISSLASDSIAVGSVFGPAVFITKDTEQAENTLTVSAASSNTTLVPLSGIVLTGTTYGRTVQVTPASGQSGRATITLTVSDGTNTSSSAFVLDVIASNTPPSFTSLPRLTTMSVGDTPQPVAFTISDTETQLSDLRVTATSSNTTLLPNASITLGGSGANRTLMLTPASGQNGAATVTLALNDGDHVRRAQTLLVVIDSNGSAAQFSRPRGVYCLDSAGATNYTTTFGKAISLRDGNIRTHSFVDGFTLRVAWDDVESDTSPGSYDFFIIQNALNKLPAGQHLSLIITPDDPTYIAATSGVQTWSDAGLTRATPWDPYLRQRRRAMLAAMGSVTTGGVALRNDPRLHMLDPYLPGGFTGIRDPNSTPMRNLPGYTRQKFLEAVQDELRSLQNEFPGKFVQIGFWSQTDNENASYGGIVAADWIRQQLLAEFNGIIRPRIGFFMENLAAKRNGPLLDPYSATPVTGFATQEFAARDATWNGFQMLGSWTRPFNDGHVTNTLYGSPAEALEYAFNTYRAEYHEVYIGDIDNTAMQPMLQAWHDFYSTTLTTSGSSDEDHDGLPLAWELQFGLDPTLPNTATDDGDHDGVPLLLEYAFNQNPNANSAGGLPTTSAAINPADGLAYLLFHYIRRTGTPSLSYTVQVSDTLGAWQSGPAVTQEVSATASGDGVTEIVTVRILPAISASNARRFVRLLVQ